MKIGTKLILSAAVSLLIGIAVAAPLLASELQIIPFISHIKGPAADYNLDLVYANFTVTTPDTPITKNSGPTISYFTVINVTNPSEYATKLNGLRFTAAQKIENSTGLAPSRAAGNWSTSSGWNAKGAWVDGIWYNVTWDDGSCPYFDENGVLKQWRSANYTGHWMEGVQLYKRTVGNMSSSTTSIYMNMNGTWADVTGRITVDLPHGSSFSVINGLVMQNVFIQDIVRGTATSGSVNASGEFTDYRFSYSSTRNIIIGDNYGFKNRFEPHQSRLIVISGSYQITSQWSDGKQLEALKSGKLDIKIISANALADVHPEIVNNTMIETWAENLGMQQITVTHVGDSYIYNNALKDNQLFNVDQYGVEAFITERS